jgi:anti-anti-sigma factor
VVLDFSAVTFLNSSNLGALLRLRKRMMDLQRRLLLCGVGSKVWGSLIVTGLDKIFHFTDDVSTALATMQMGKA